MTLLERLVAAYRRTGADLPGSDPRPTHGAEMEGWFWRFTEPASGRVALALCGVNQRAGAEPWATVAIAAHPGGIVRTAALAPAAASASSLHLEVGGGDGLLRADERSLEVVIGDVALRARLDDVVGWPHRLGAGGLFAVLPWLGQYWQPHVLGGRADVELDVAGERWHLEAARPYAEKNWGAGFPERWWWLQAQAFEREDACVAAGGGRLAIGPATIDAGGLVVRLGGQVLRFAPPTALVSGGHADGTWHVRARSLGWEVEVEGDAAGSPELVLPVPLPAEGANVMTDWEPQAGRVSVVVRRRGQVAWRGESALAALEHGRLPTDADERTDRLAPSDAPKSAHLSA